MLLLEEVTHSINNNNIHYHRFRYLLLSTTLYTQSMTLPLGSVVVPRW